MNAKLLLIILIVPGCLSTHSPGYSEIDTSCDLCIVSGELNGKRTYFLIDTGAGITTLDLNQSKFFGFTYILSDLQVGGFTNTVGSIKEARGIDSIKINGIKIAGDLIYAENMTNLVKFIERCSHKTISGIIGVPMIKGQGLIIDLVNNKLYKH
jgi:hypothetical protein